LRRGPFHDVHSELRQLFNLDSHSDRRIPGQSEMPASDFLVRSSPVPPLDLVERGGIGGEA